MVAELGENDFEGGYTSIAGKVNINAFFADTMRFNNLTSKLPWSKVSLATGCAKGFFGHWPKVSLATGQRLLWPLAEGLFGHWPMVSLATGRRFVWLLAEGFFGHWPKIS